VGQVRVGAAQRHSFGTRRISPRGEVTGRRAQDVAVVVTGHQCARKPLSSNAVACRSSAAGGNRVAFGEPTGSPAESNRVRDAGHGVPGRMSAAGQQMRQRARGPPSTSHTAVRTRAWLPCYGVARCRAALTWAGPRWGGLRAACARRGQQAAVIQPDQKRACWGDVGALV